MIFNAYGAGPLTALALAATLYHCLNHAFFKSLLFLVDRHGAACDQRAQPGQARRTDPARCRGSRGWAVGTIAIAGLPPLNGFVSEWLLLQAFLATPGCRART
jgi:formate hydrogenlyase subunit 3/multisubunit Na+/H+ antiporter MnhD subunit